MFRLDLLASFMCFIISALSFSAEASSLKPKNKLNKLQLISVKISDITDGSFAVKVKAEAGNNCKIPLENELFFHHEQDDDSNFVVNVYSSGKRACPQNHRPVTYEIDLGTFLIPVDQDIKSVIVNGIKTPIEE